MLVLRRKKSKMTRINRITNPDQIIEYGGNPTEGNYFMREPSLTRKAAGGLAKLAGKGIVWVGRNVITRPVKAGIKDYKSRKFDVVPQEIVVVLNDKYHLFKNERDMDNGLENGLQEALNMINLMSYTLPQIYKEKPYLFAKGARVLEPRSKPYFKWPGQHPIRIEEDPITIDPPATEETADFYGYPLVFNVDTKLKYRKHPLFFPLITGGKLIRHDPDWEETLHNNLIGEVEQMVHEHFLTHKTFPEVCQKPVDTRTMNQKKAMFLREYGVIPEIKIQKFRPAKGQKDIIMTAMEQQFILQREKGGDLKTFLDAAKEIGRLSERMDTGKHFSEMFNGFIEYSGTNSPTNHLQLPPPKRKEIQGDFEIEE